MRAILIAVVHLLFSVVASAAPKNLPPTSGLASWYGEEHRGNLMANGRRFGFSKLTAASWFYPLGIRVRVIVWKDTEPPRSVTVTITDRGPECRLVKQGRIIDLSHAAFEPICSPKHGLAKVVVLPVT